MSGKFSLNNSGIQYRNPTKMVIDIVDVVKITLNYQEFTIDINPEYKYNISYIYE